MSVMVGPSLPPCRDEGVPVPVHHDPVHGIVANPGNREWGQSPLSFFAVCDNPVHRVLVNWDPPISQVIDLLGPFQKGNASIMHSTARVCLLVHKLLSEAKPRHTPHKRAAKSSLMHARRRPDMNLSDITSCT